MKSIREMFVKNIRKVFSFKKMWKRKKIIEKFFL